MEQEVQETVEEPLALDSLSHNVLSFLVLDTHEFFLMLQEHFRVENYLIRLVNLHFCFFIVIELLKFIISMIPRDLLEDRVVEFVMQTRLLIVWIISRLQIVEQLVHIQDHK